MTALLNIAVSPRVKNRTARQVETSVSANKPSSIIARRGPACGLLLMAYASIGSAATTPVSADDAKLLAHGRHLARECTSCHRLDGADNGIPSVIGWPKETFLTTIKFYRDGSRTNPVMVSVASSLTDEQMEALAAFFGSLPRPASKPPGKKPTK